MSHESTRYEAISFADKLSVLARAVLKQVDLDSSVVVVYNKGNDELRELKRLYPECTYLILSDNYSVEAIEEIMEELKYDLSFAGVVPRYVLYDNTVDSKLFSIRVDGLCGLSPTDSTTKVTLYSKH